MKDEMERMKMVKAMEFIVRNLNDETVFESWLYSGVADGDIEYGDLCITDYDFDTLDYYIEEDNFKDLMSLFLKLMSKAYKSGGLFCGGVTNR